MELQHINVKALLDRADGIDLEPLVPVFHDWIQSQPCEELLLDVADYRHVHASPGIILIGLEANYSVDNTANRLGVRYNRKAPLGGGNVDRLQQAARAAFTACRELERDPRLGGKFHFDGQRVEISINDRLLAPNRPETREAIQPELSAFLQKLFGGGEYSLTFNSEPRELFSVAIESARTYSTETLLQHLAA
jgi:hypothetical protein